MCAIGGRGGGEGGQVINCIMNMAFVMKCFRVYFDVDNLILLKKSLDSHV